MHFLPGFPHALQGARCVFCRRGRHRVFVTFHADDIRHQHGVMRSHRTTRFGDYRRMWQTIFFTRITNRPDDVVGVFIEAVVYGAVRLRTGAFIVHAQTAADVEALNIDAQLVQFHIETRGFTTPVAISRIFAICEPRWKCSSCRLSRRPASRSVSTSCST